MTTPILQFDIGLDLFPLIAGTLAAVCCGLLGNFLVLRRLSLMGDAISHSVLPGLVIAFLIASTRSPLIMFLGAAIAGTLTVVLVELVKKLGRVEPGAAMGVVFSVLFALGVLLIERAAVRHIDLDADCVLHGQLETLIWFNAPDTLAALFDWSTLEAVPRQVTTLAIMTALAFAFVALFFKELRIAAFDPDLATTQGFNATLLHYLLMIFVAAATVASFEAVGSILVIAMLVCPAATARLLTDRLPAQIAATTAIALITGIAGYFAATSIPAIFNKEEVNAAGSITITAGTLLTLAIIASPRHGIITRLLRRQKLAARIATDDLLAALYRATESGLQGLTQHELKTLLPARPIDTAINNATRAGHITIQPAQSQTQNQSQPQPQTQTPQTKPTNLIKLTDTGKDAAAEIIRRHRRWETYLVTEAGLAPDHVHAPAEQLEHVETEPPEGPTQDPHGRDIP